MHTPPLQRLAKYALLCLPLAVVACDEDDDGIDILRGDEVNDVLNQNDQFSTLRSELNDADLLSPLDDADAVTLFAPNNNAFAAVDLSGVSDDDLRATLLYHAILGQTIRAANIEEGLSIVRTTDNMGPSLIIENDGGSVDVNGANVIATDLETENGVIHEIDQVLMMPDVVDLATYPSALTTLVSEVTRAGLVETLQGEGPFTVFAPTNQAFDDFPTNGVTGDRLTEVLTYHVLPGVVLAGDIMDGMTAMTVQGDELTFNVDGDGNVTITDGDDDSEDFSVIIPNVRGTNGVVHVIDGVLRP